MAEAKRVQTVGSPRRIGAATSKTRSMLLDAAEDLMRESGYAAVTSRRLAERAGLKPQLVHYYFRSMDDLFLALFRRIADAHFARQDEMLASGEAIDAVWALSNDSSKIVLNTEFVALANHRKAIRAEIAEFGERYRRRQVEILSRFLDKAGLDPADWPPIGVAVLIESVARCLAMEDGLGMSAGHAEALGIIGRLIGQLDGAAKASDEPIVRRLNSK